MSDGVGLVVQPRQASEDEEMTINSLMGNGAFCVSSSGMLSSLTRVAAFSARGMIMLPPLVREFY